MNENWNFKKCGVVLLVCLLLTAASTIGLTYLISKKCPDCSPPETMEGVISEHELSCTTIMRYECDTTSVMTDSVIVDKGGGRNNFMPFPVPKTNTDKVLKLRIVSNDSINKKDFNCLLQSFVKVNKSFEKASIVFQITEHTIVKQIPTANLLQENQFELWDKWVNTLKQTQPKNTIDFFVITDDESKICQTQGSTTTCSRTYGWSRTDHSQKALLITTFAIPNHKVIGHEIGHLLGLHHTFETRFNQDNLNCENTGDLICDTPYDPIFANEYVQYNNCEMKHPLNYTPLIENYMSYYGYCTSKESSFTTQQLTFCRFNAELHH